MLAVSGPDGHTAADVTAHRRKNGCTASPSTVPSTTSPDSYPSGSRSMTNVGAPSPTSSPPPEPAATHMENQHAPAGTNPVETEEPTTDLTELPEAPVIGVRVRPISGLTSAARAAFADAVHRHLSDLPGQRIPPAAVSA